MRSATSLLCLLAATAAADDAAPVERRLALRAADVGRLALKNGPDYRARELDPSIARTHVDEALGAFDSLFTSHAGGGGSRSEVYYDPAATGRPSGTASDPPLASESHIGAGAGVGATQEWGGAWRLGFDALSTDRRGAASVQSFDPRFDGGLVGNYRQPLLRGAGRDRNLAPVREAEWLTRDSELLLAREAELAVERAEDAYWNLVGVSADRDLKRKSLQVAKELREVIRARVAGGRGLPVDETEATAGVAKREVELIFAENVVATQGDRLRALILPFDGESPDLDLVVVPADAPAASVAPVPAMPGAAELAAAIERRADLRAGAARLEAARIVEERTKSDLLPSLDAVVAGGLGEHGVGFAEAWRKIGERRGYTWDGGLELSVPLGNLAAEAQALRARRERGRRERELSALRSSLVRELREAARDVRSAADRIEAAVRASRAAAEQLDAQRSRLDGGRATPFDVLKVEEDLTQAAASEVLARVDYEKARVAVLRAEGSLLDARGLASAVPGE